MTATGTSLPSTEPLASSVGRALAEWEASSSTRRLWERDNSLWTGRDEDRWLGWLDLPRNPGIQLSRLAELAQDARRFSHVLLLGMGGSSLCPEVLALTFGRQPGHPEMVVLDSTDPSQVRRAEASVDLAKTLVVVASKSGSTLEPEILRAHFFERLRGLHGDRAGQSCLAITDPGSKLEARARADGYRHVLPGIASVGGRFSALSPFGLVPAALAGLDVSRLLEHAREMAEACGPQADAARNPGVSLGLVLGTAARMGRDKLTLVLSPGLAALGAWLEQLIAESTGKQGRAIIPVDGEPLTGPAGPGDDRLYLEVSLAGEREPVREAALAALERAGQPVVRIEVASREHLFAELFRFEIATAVAGAVMGVHPFDQPDVEASKLETRRLTTEYEKTGSLPAEEAFLESEGLRLFAPLAHQASLGQPTSLADALSRHFSTWKPSDYVAVLAYLDRSPALHQQLARLRRRIFDRTGAATCLGFGPRFLHSTGQAYKGGPNTGVFLQITCDESNDLPVPGQRATFGAVKAAQARGDFEVLAARGRRAVRVHLPADVEGGLKRLDAALAEALSRLG